LEVQRQCALLVGPQFQSASSVIEWLHSRRCECFLVPTLQEAYDSIRSRPFDLVLCSNRLPDGAGFSLIELLTGHPVSLFISHPVEDACIWLPALIHGVQCWGSSALKPKAAVRLIDEVIAANRKRLQPDGCLDGSTFRNLVWRDFLVNQKGAQHMEQQSVCLMQVKEEAVNLMPVSSEEFSKYRQQIFDLVARRAYEVFESRGRVHGYDWDDWYQAESETLRPVHVELSDAGNALVAVAAVTGYHPENLKISAEPRRLWICGLSPVADVSYDGPDARPIGSGPFLRSFSLSADINTSEVSTEIGSEVLEVRMPKNFPQSNGY
jgi:HSP20 family molecular chaperone IbpA/CheY-like chemotaxis protein